MAGRAAADGTPVRQGGATTLAVFCQTLSVDVLWRASFAARCGGQQNQVPRATDLATKISGVI